MKTNPSAARVASMFSSHPCMQGGPCQCGGGCGQQPMIIQPTHGQVEEGDGESYMSIQALQSMKDHADDLLDLLDRNTPLPDWVEAKLTEAATQLNNVYEYMTHGHPRKHASLESVSKSGGMRYRS
jgi:hypothetical protein